MILLGEVKKIVVNPSGYECCTLISFDKICESYWCYTLLDKYISPLENPQIIYANVEDKEPIQLKIGDKREFKVSVIFVTSIEIISNNERLSIEQPIKNSSHSIFKGIVKEFMDEKLLICNIEPFINIQVDFESKIDRIKIGDAIKFSGEIKIDLISS